jgi:hypothetical protein
MTERLTANRLLDAIEQKRRIPLAFLPIALQQEASRLSERLGGRTLIKCGDHTGPAPGGKGPQALLSHR